MASSKLRTIVVAGAAAMTMAVGIMPANAATTFTLKAGNAPTGTAVAFKGTTTGATPQVTFKDVTQGQTLTCDAATASGKGTTGTGLAGAAIGAIAGNTTTWTNCQGPLGIQLTPVGKGSWKLNAVSYSNGVTTGTITGAQATVSGSGCVFTVKGSVPITYTNSTGILAVSGAKANLTVSNASNCFGLIVNGDKASFSAAYQLKATKTSYNPVTITAP